MKFVNVYLTDNYSWVDKVFCKIQSTIKYKCKEKRKDTFNFLKKWTQTYLFHGISHILDTVDKQVSEIYLSVFS